MDAFVKGPTRENLAQRWPKVGLDLHPTQTSWADLERAARRADQLGYDSLWTWDHLYGLDEPATVIFEGWSVVAGWASITTRPTVGLLVTANTFRNPGLLAKIAVTVDHISRGRCVLGMGGGWRPREHHDLGIEFGSSIGERLTWLDESLEIVRALLEGGEAASEVGTHYSFHNASQRPLPVRGPGRLPILIGGGGEQRTLRIAARHADIWHHRGTVAALTGKRDVLRRWCDTIGRDHDSIEHAFGPRVMIRDDPTTARRELESAVRATGDELEPDPDAAWCGPPDEIAARWEPFLRAGFTHLIAGIVAPYDVETIERLIDVRAMLGGDPSLDKRAPDTEGACGRGADT